MITPTQLREWAAEAHKGYSVELSPEELTGLADQLEHPQCGGAAQMLLTRIGDRPSMEVTHEELENVAFDSLLTRRRLNATEAENADLLRELEARRGKLVCWVDERRRDAA